MVKAVVCVYKSGGDYSLEYVRRLGESVKKYSNKPFVCLSDIQKAADLCDLLIPLQNNWPGWWSKLELFIHLKSALYFDLDTVLNGSIQDLCDYPHKFTMLKDFNSRNTRPTSGIMAWNGDYTYLADEFDMSRVSKYSRYGDQAYISDYLKFNPDLFQLLFPVKFASFKWSSVDDKKLADVICYHGKPRPHQTGWIL